MNFQELKERVLTDRLFKGVMIGELLILIIVWIVRLIPAPSGREAAIPDADPSCPEQNVAARADKRAETVSEGEVYEYGIPLSRYRKVEGNIRKGEFFSTLMTRLGASQSDIYALDALSKGVFDMRQMKVGYHYHAYYLPGEPDTLAQVVYEKDNASYVVFTLRDSLSVRVEDLADIYAWSIDFFGLQKGDSFKAVYEKSECDGEILDVERVLYAEFTHGDQVYKSYWFDDGSGNYYWNEKGESMRKAFLRAPLSYTRISSGFTYSRRHPITRKVRPHTGIDYAAPAGTEVMSIGDGVVVYKGFKTAEGNMVKIKHNSVYTSAYLHLSRYGKNISVGQRVKQGQVIGYVGSTGYSTGPHLDFRIWKNGTPINPLKMESPPAEPLSKDDMPAFLKSMKESENAASRFGARTVLRQMVETIKK